MKKNNEMAARGTDLIRAERVTKGFLQPDRSRLVVLDQLDFLVQRGELAVITGVSGSGKSTLLHLLGALDKADRGEIWFEDRNIQEFNKREISEYRNRQIGFVFQFHYLMPELTVKENTAFPFLMTEFNKKEAGRRASALLEEVGLKDKMDNMPHELSGGERQRVAIARGLINSPRLLLADEPTGNIDYKTGEKIFRFLKGLIKDRGLTCVVVTHNEQFAREADCPYKLIDGRLQAGH